MIYDVEMEGKTGHMAHVYVQAENAGAAERLASQYFPELETTGNTIETIGAHVA